MQSQDSQNDHPTSIHDPWDTELLTYHSSDSDDDTDTDDFDPTERQTPFSQQSTQLAIDTPNPTASQISHQSPTTPSTTRQHHSSAKIITSVDPIVNPAGCHVRLIKTDFQALHPTSFLMRAMHLLSHVPTSEFAVKHERDVISQQQYVTTGQRFTIPSHVQQHLLPGVLPLFRQATKSEEKKIRFFMRVFIVRKPHTTMGRIIGHPMQLNEARKERRFALATLSTLLHLLEPLKNTAYVLEFDFKNYFPQLPLSNPAALLMGSVINGTTYIPVSLTQGWNSATFIAQSVSWGIITGSPHNDTLGLDLDWSDDIPPAFARLNHPQHGIGLICILYDNILIVTASETLRDLWKKRILHNCQNRRYNVIIKYLNTTYNVFSYCGYDFRLTDAGAWQWRTDHQRFALWQTRQFQTKTPAAAAAMVAYILRQTSIRYHLLVSQGRVLKAASDIGTTMSGCDKKAWKKPHAVAQRHWEILTREFSNLSNPWCFHLPRDLTELNIVFACSDATLSIIGWVTLDPESGTVTQKLQQDITHATIDVAETWALTNLCLGHQPIHTACYTIVLVDNIITSRNTASGYSSITQVDEHITSISAAVPLQRLLLVDCPTEHNLADSMTRHDYELTSPDAIRRHKNSYRILCAAREFFSTNSTNWMSRLVVRDLCGPLDGDKKLKSRK